jgi:hypothetical protein
MSLFVSWSLSFVAYLQAYWLLQYRAGFTLRCHSIQPMHEQTPGASPESLRPLPEQDGKGDASQQENACPCRLIGVLADHSAGATRDLSRPVFKVGPLIPNPGDTVAESFPGQFELLTRRIRSRFHKILSPAQDSSKIINQFLVYF